MTPSKHFVESAIRIDCENLIYSGAIPATCPLNIQANGSCTLPNATTLPIGWELTIRWEGNGFALSDAGAIPLFGPSSLYQIIRVRLANNTTINGQWEVRTVFGEVSGGATANGAIRYNPTTGDIEAYLNGAWTPLISQQQMVNINYNSNQVDAAQRLNVSIPTTIFESKYIAGDLPQLWQTVNFDAPAPTIVGSSKVMTVNGADQYVILNSWRRMGYQAGKSMRKTDTCRNFDIEANVIKRWGMFRSTTTPPYNSLFDGFWLEASGAEHSIKVYNNGTLVHDIPRSTWDNPMDGTVDDVTINWANGNIMDVDYLWLGYGSIRFFCDIQDSSGKATRVLFHQLDNQSMLSDTFMRNSNQPVRYEIRTLATPGTGTFTHTCTSVEVGVSDVVGYQATANTGTLQYTLQTATQAYALLAIKYQPGLDLPLNIKGGSIMGTSNDDFLWELCLNPTIVGGFSYSNIPNSVCQKGVGTIVSPGNTTATVAPAAKGIVLASGYGRQTTVIQIPENVLALPGVALDGTSDVLALVVTPISTGLTVSASLNWDELV